MIIIQYFIKLSLLQIIQIKQHCQKVFIIISHKLYGKVIVSYAKNRMSTKHHKKLVVYDFMSHSTTTYPLSIIPNVWKVELFANNLITMVHVDELDEWLVYSWKIAWLREQSTNPKFYANSSHFRSIDM